MPYDSHLTFVNRGVIIQPGHANKHIKIHPGTWLSRRVLTRLDSGGSKQISLAVTREIPHTPSLRFICLGPGEGTNRVSLDLIIRTIQVTAWDYISPTAEQSYLSAKEFTRQITLTNLTRTAHSRTFRILPHLTVLYPITWGQF